MNYNPKIQKRGVHFGIVINLRLALIFSVAAIYLVNEVRNKAKEQGIWTFRENKVISRSANSIRM